jgi:phosphoserine phosphatase RsbU/P
VLKLGESRLALCIADVSGKGVPAALLMANVQASLRASVRDLDSPARVCGIINGMLCESIAAGKFVTFFCGVLDATSHTFRYCNAGHPYPILVSSGALRTLDQGGAVLGVFPAWTYQDLCADLSSGDRLLLFTDGITEAEGPHGEEFGAEKVAAFAKAHAANAAARMNQQLLAQVTEFCGGQFQDDATLLVLAVKLLLRGEQLKSSRTPLFRFRGCRRHRKHMQLVIAKAAAVVGAERLGLRLGVAGRDWPDPGGCRTTAN